MFEPYAEYKLPPEKGTGLHKWKKKTAKGESVPDPREFQYSPDYLVLLDEAASKAEPGYRTHVEKGEPRAKSESEPATEPVVSPRDPVPVKTHVVPAKAPVASSKATSSERAPEAAAPGEEPRSESSLVAEAEAVVERVLAQTLVVREQAPVPGAPASPPALEVASLPAVDIASTPARQPDPPPTEETERFDYIISYDGQYVGHFSSSKRMASRTAYKKVAQRLVEDIEQFDLGKLVLFKPTPIKVDRTTLAAELGDDSFNWFAKESNVDLVADVT